ncbi:MAG: PilW family protein [Pseudomonadota bacterium]
MNRLFLRHIKQQGFSLAELMVAMVIGLVASLVIQQMFSVFSAQSRTTTSGADAQENGLVASQMIERDIRSAGYGLTNSALLNCTTTYTYRSDIDAPIPNFSLRGFSITDGGAGPDELTFQYGTSIRAGVDSTISDTMPQSSSELKVSNTNGFSDGDLMMVVQGTKCTLMQITQVQAASFHLQHNPGGSGLTYNPTVPFQTTNAWPAYDAGASLFNLGSITSRQYKILNNSLQLSEDSGVTFNDLVRDIVTIQAQYGITATAVSSDHAVTKWVNATVDPTTGTNWAAPSATDFQRIKAIRFAVVARSNLRESTQVTSTSLTLWPQVTSGQTTSGLTYAVADADRYYRYKVYQTVVPMRNVIWGSN